MSEEKKNEEGTAETPENQPADDDKKVSDVKVGDSAEKKESARDEKTEEVKAESGEKDQKVEEKSTEKSAEEKTRAESAPEAKAFAEEKAETEEKPKAEVKAEAKPEAKVDEEPKSEEKAEEKTEPKAEDDAVKEEAGDDDGDAEATKEEEEEFPDDKGPHDEFDWDLGNDYKLPYSDSEVESMLETYDDTLTLLGEGEVVKGKVKTIHDGDVILDLNYKSDGLVSLSEFRDNPDLAQGDEVDVYVEKKEDERGQLVLSRRKAKLLKAWEAIVDSYKNGTVIRGKVVSKTKGGLIADCSGLETFLPGSQIDIKPIIDYDSYVGKTMDFKVVKINEMIKNAVVSHKALIESDLAEQREQIIAGLEKGQVLEGTVKNLTDFGAFMDLGGVDGLLYITDISWGRINHPSEVLSLNDQVNVVVLDFDENKKRISLGLKQLQPHPWDVVGESIKEESVVKGKIVNIEDYGAFLEIKPGVEGLIHVSEVSWSNQPVNAREFFKLGEEMEAMVVTIDHDERKMSLSIKKLTEDPWSKIEDKYPVGSRHSGEVKNLTPYGVFVELDDGIGGMVHISDLSWTKRFSHPSEFTKVGENIEIVILEIDKDGRKLSLGHKQIEENPWDTFQTVFPVGSYHEATIIRKDDRGAIVQLPYGLEAFAPIKHIRKEDGTMAEVEEVLTVKVIEFNADDKRILVSHRRYLEDIQREAKDEVRKEKMKEEKQTRKAVQQTQKKVERTTLGELGVLSQLKESLEDDKPDSTEKVAEKEETASEEKAKKTEEKAHDVGAEADDAKAKADDASGENEAGDAKTEEGSEKPDDVDKTEVEKDGNDSDDKDKEEK
ncbi:MAG: 30S ribosomal protein S1 [Saprospirales bacterium]|nr:MAG: 30S ribosomal protein S1 [Saprospirales bacterium]